jgi:hypothetical protein
VAGISSFPFDLVPPCLFVKYTAVPFPGLVVEHLTIDSITARGDTTRLFDSPGLSPAWIPWARSTKYKAVETDVLNVLLDVQEPIIVHIHQYLSCLSLELFKYPSPELLSTMICGVAGLMATVKKLVPAKRKELDDAWLPFVAWLIVRYPPLYQKHGGSVSMMHQQQDGDAMGVPALPSSLPVESLMLSNLVSCSDDAFDELFVISDEAKAWAKKKNLWRELVGAFTRVSTFVMGGLSTLYAKWIYGYCMCAMNAALQDLGALSDTIFSRMLSGCIVLLSKQLHAPLPCDAVAAYISGLSWVVMVALASSQTVPSGIRSQVEVLWQQIVAFIIIRYPDFCNRKKK